MGSAAYYVHYKSNYYEFRKFDYSEQDSLFLNSDKRASNDTAESKIIEKTIDSEQELQDFSVDKKDLSQDEKSYLLEHSININTARVEDLILLPGIGPKTAQKIVEYRNLNGNFANIDDLVNVKGIGPKKFNEIKKFIIVE